MVEKEKILELRDLKMNFGVKQVLNGINLEVYKGQIIGYIGPNGAGKSTTLKIMLGLIEGYEGEVVVFGENIKTSGVAYKQRIGYVPETADLYDNLTACEYITFVGELYGLTRKVAEEKGLLLLSEFGMEDVFHQRISSFSKGMRQKVLLASSLVHNPDLIFLDEPLSGLDANSVMVVKDILEALKNEGKTIFYSSHMMDIVERISNRIVLLHGGQIVADGSFEQLKEQNKQGSLEGIFNQLTGYDAHRHTAKRFVEIVTGKESNADE